MPSQFSLLDILGLCIVGIPLVPLAFFLAFFPALRPMGERTIARLLKGTVGAGILATAATCAVMLEGGIVRHPIELGDWVAAGHHHIKFEFVLDLLSLTYAGLTLVLCAVVGVFSVRYLHREAGYNRFFILFTLFLFGMLVTALSDTVETLFVGWELVGISSVLLIGFFHERAAPVQNGLRVWAVYRFGDAALVLAALLMHEFFGSGDFHHLASAADQLGTPQTLHWTILGALFVIAAACKSALVPFSGWMPRAMEGPTTSTAVFYGAISVHLGAFLLLRISPILDHTPWIPPFLVVLGLLTTVLAYLCGRVQTDVKSALSFSVLTQVGLIMAEIGLGLHTFALIHLVGHACLRTLQFLRAPSFLQDHHHQKDAIGHGLPAIPDTLFAKLPGALRRPLYRFALERGFLDTLIDRLVVRPFAAVFRACDRADRAIAALLDGAPRA